MDEYNARRASINKIQKALEDQLTNVETQKEEIAKLKVLSTTIALEILCASHKFEVLAMYQF